MKSHHVSTTCKLFYFYKNDSGIYFSLFDESCNWLLLLFTKLYTKLNKSTTLQKIIFVLYSYFFCSFFVAPNLQSVARFSLCLSMYVEKWVCRNTSWASHRKRSSPFLLVSVASASFGMSFVGFSVGSASFPVGWISWVVMISCMFLLQKSSRFYNTSRKTEIDGVTNNFNENMRCDRSKIAH